MVVQPDKILTETFFSEHEAIRGQNSQVCEFMKNQINVLNLDFQEKNMDLASVEKIIAWKSILKKVLWHFSDYLKDHIERETAFLDLFTGSGLEPEALKKNEAVLEHMDELVWLLDNSPARKMPELLGYIGLKANELYQGVIEHCQHGGLTLKLVEEIEGSIP